MQAPFLPEKCQKMDRYKSQEKWQYQGQKITQRQINCGKDPGFLKIDLGLFTHQKHLR
jgi:hypothetical protein